MVIKTHTLGLRRDPDLFVTSLIYIGPDSTAIDVHLVPTHHNTPRPTSNYKIDYFSETSYVLYTVVQTVSCGRGLHKPKDLFIISPFFLFSSSPSPHSIPFFLGSSLLYI